MSRGWKVDSGGERPQQCLEVKPGMPLTGKRGKKSGLVVSVTCGFSY